MSAPLKVEAELHNDATMDRIDYLEKELLRLLEWIKAADSRVSLVLPLITAMLGAIAALAPALEKWTWPLFISIAVSLLLLMGSLIAISMALFPRTSAPSQSMVFFGGLCSRSLEQYRADVAQFDRAQYQADLINQCYINAQICGIKFKWVRKSLVFLLLASVPWLHTIFSLYGLE